MGVRLQRAKPRNFLASAAYGLKPLLPLDALLDIAAVASRLALEKAGERGLDIWGENPFLHKHIRPSDRVLEIGCASGRVLSQVVASERVGVDCNEELIERGRRDHPQLTLICGDGRDHVDAGFDVLILSHVLEHVDRPEEFLRSIRASRIYVEVPDFDSTILNAVRLRRSRSWIYTDEDHVAEFDRDELEALFKSVGLDILDREFRWGFMRYWLTPQSGS